jgi:hypothetical protein
MKNFEQIGPIIEHTYTVNKLEIIFFYLNW